MEDNSRHYEWCYVSGWVNVLECSLLTQKFFEAALSSNDFRDTLALLNGTSLKTAFSHVKHLYEYETLLDEYYDNRLCEIRSLSPDSAVCDFFLLRNDVLNLKRFVKSRVSGAGMDKFSRGTFSKEAWDNAWQDKPTALPDVFRESVSLIRKVFADGTEKGTPPHATQGKKESLPCIIDLILDGAYLRYVEDYGKKMKSEIIKRYVTLYQLMKGLEVMWRALSLQLNMQLLDQYFLGGFEQHHVFRKLGISTVWTSEEKLREVLEDNFENLFVHKSSGWAMHELPLPASNVFPKVSFRYEVAADNYLLDMLRPVKLAPFGPERVFGYLCGLTTEVFNVKLLLGGKVHRTENNLLRERLRKPYV